MTFHCNPAITKMTIHMYTSKGPPSKGKGAKSPNYPEGIIGKHSTWNAMFKAWKRLLQNILPPLRIWGEPATDSLNHHRPEADKKWKLQRHLVEFVNRPDQTSGHSPEQASRPLHSRLHVLPLAPCCHFCLHRGNFHLCFLFWWFLTNRSWGIFIFREKLFL